jgi:hypothetical protein
VRGFVIGSAERLLRALEALGKLLGGRTGRWRVSARVRGRRASIRRRLRTGFRLLLLFLLLPPALAQPLDGVVVGWRRGCATATHLLLFRFLLPPEAVAENLVDFLPRF